MAQVAKINRARWLNQKFHDCCAVCLENGEPVSRAEECDGYHFHLDCGGQVYADDEGIFCSRSHKTAKVIGNTVKTRAEAMRRP